MRETYYRLLPIFLTCFSLVAIISFTKFHDFKNIKSLENAPAFLREQIFSDSNYCDTYYTFHKPDDIFVCQWLDEIRTDSNAFTEDLMVMAPETLRQKAINYFFRPRMTPAEHQLLYVVTNFIIISIAPYFHFKIKFDDPLLISCRQNRFASFHNFGNIIGLPEA